MIRLDNVIKIFSVVALALLVFGSTASFPQERAPREPAERFPGPLPDRAIPCPVPMNITLTAPPPTQATRSPLDFPPPFPIPSPPAGGFEPNFGGTAINRVFGHTFTWKLPTECCQYLRGTLTFQYKSISGGQSATSPDAGNDTWFIVKNHNILASGPLYTSFPFPPGTSGTKTIPLTPAMLAGERLSFGVQDDTSVMSATLNVVACCVRK